MVQRFVAYVHLPQPTVRHTGDTDQALFDSSALLHELLLLTVCLDFFRR